MNTAQKVDEFDAIAMKTNPPAGVRDIIEGTSFARRTCTKTQMAAKQCTEQQICKNEYESFEETRRDCSEKGSCSQA